MQKLFQKLATFVLIITMMGAPLTSAIGQSFACNMQLESSTMLNSATKDTVKNTVTKVMSVDHSCCEKLEKSHCAHNGECDCDNAQMNLNGINVQSVDLVLIAPITQFATTFYTIQITELFSSLYRPPRNIL